LDNGDNYNYDCYFRLYSGDSANKKNITKATSDLSVSLPAKDKIIFYYGITCPHCKDVEDWMEKNKIEGKIKVEKKSI
jgi:glutaredoxin